MGHDFYHMLPKAGALRSGILRQFIAGLKNPTDLHGMLCLFPTKLYLENFRRKVLHCAAGSCYIPPDMMTLGALAQRTEGMKVLDSALRPTVISSLTGKGPGWATLASNFIGEMKMHFPLASSEEIRPVLFKAFEDAGAPQEVSGHAMEALDCLRQYDKALRASGYTDPDDTLAICAKEIDKDFSCSAVVLDGFYELSPAELMIVSALLRQSEDTLAFVPVGNEDRLEHCYTNDISETFGIKPRTLTHDSPEKVLPGFMPSPSRESEVEAIARHIKQGYLSSKSRELEDTLLVFPALSNYRATASRVLKRYGVPADSSSLSPSLATHGPWADVLQMLQAVRDGYPRLGFGRFLTSPHFRKIPQELKLSASRAVLGSGVVKGRQAWAEALEGNRSVWLFKILDKLYEIRVSGTFEAYTGALKFALDALAFSPGDSGPEPGELLSKLLQCHSIWGKPINLASFTDALEALISGPVKVEPEAGIRAAGIYDVRGLEPETLYMGGLMDGAIPSRPAMDLLLPDMVRRRLKLTDLDRHMELQRKIFMRLVESADRVFLTYPEMEDDKVFLPSVFLSALDISPFSVTGHYCPDEEMTAHGKDTLLGHISEITLSGRHAMNQTLSVTEVDSYRRCPRRYFTDRVLRLEPVEIKEYEMEPTTLGTLAHRVMQELIQGPPGTLEAFTSRASTAIDAALEDSEADMFFKALLKQSFLSILPEIFEVESTIHDEGFIAELKEEKVEAELLEGVTLSGKADRVDISGSATASIIDYKTGSATLSGSGILRGTESLQLPLYAAMLRDKGMDPVRLGIYSLGKVKVKWVPSKREQKKGVTLDEYIEAALGYLRETVAEMRKGNFPAIPITDAACRGCSEVPFCPYHQHDSVSDGGPGGR